MTEIKNPESKIKNPVRVAVALGSNLGDRQRYLRDAVALLASDISSLRLSRFYETDPIGMPGTPPRVVNAAATGETTLSAHALLDRLLDVERQLGRERPYAGASRTVDLDLILYDDAVIDDPPRLIVPHPRFRDRGFVLEPLAEIAANWTDPVSGLTIARLWEALRDAHAGHEPD